jgi:tetratricopeptide (TPR) repeat protein
MRSVFLCLAVAAQIAASPVAMAQSAGSRPVSAERQKSLDDLFADLKRENKEHAAKRIADRIWAEWRDSGSASINVMMQWADEAAKAEKWGVALDFLDRVTVLEPDFAEGWNRRATVHFMMKNYAKSMADIDRTLRLEPRHFGALAGMAQILKDTGQKQLALNAYERVLQVYPMMRSAQAEVVTLSDELAGEGI